jgi:hypothetical protein
MDDNTDIVDRLRSMYYELSRRQASTPFGERSELSGIPELLYEAAIKIQDLQGNEIERLRNERDEARRMAAYQYARHYNGDEQTLIDNFYELRGWQKTPVFVGDCDHTK